MLLPCPETPVRCAVAGHASKSVSILHIIAMHIIASEFRNMLIIVCIFLSILRILHQCVQYNTLQAYQRLQKLHVCMSHDSTIKLMDNVGEGYDQKVVTWKKETEDSILALKQVSKIQFLYTWLYKRRCTI